MGQNFQEGNIKIAADPWGAGAGEGAVCTLLSGKNRGAKMLKMFSYWGARSWKGNEEKQKGNKLTLPLLPANCR